MHQSNKIIFVGATWTTDAPFRETAAAIAAAHAKGILAVEMEARFTPSLISATGAAVLCLAHVTNTMGRTGDDFEKGEADGTADALAILEALLPIAHARDVRGPSGTQHYFGELPLADAARSDMSLRSTMALHRCEPATSVARGQGHAVDI